MLVLDDNDNLVDVDGKNIASVVKVYDVTGGAKTLLEGDALTAMVAVDAAKNSYDFTEAAIGRSFMLEIHPASGYVDEAAVTKSHTVTVVDGYNVYEAWELNLITNLDGDLDGGSIENYNSQIEAVDKFLATKGATRPATLAGVVLHGNLDLKLSDIPEEYIYTYTKGGVQKKGFYDHMSVFNRVLDNANPTFTYYGNYYSLYTYNLTEVVENGVANNDDPNSSSEIFRFQYSNKLSSLDFDQSKYVVNVVNAAFRDNDPNSNDQSASERHMRGLLCMKITGVTANYTNVNIDAYIISMCVEFDTSIVNLNKVKFYNAWQGHLFLWNYNIIYEDLGIQTAPPADKHSNMKINITDSLLAKCGGPVILSQNLDADKPWNTYSGADVKTDSKSELYSYVTGQEAWFVAYGQTALAGQIVAMNQLITLYGGYPTGQSASFSASDKIQGVNTVNIIMVNMGTGSAITATGDKYNGSYQKGDVVGLSMTNNPMLDAYNQFFDYAVQTGQAAQIPPFFQSSSGGIAYTDGATGCYSVNFGDYSITNAPDASFYQGEFLTLYYMGIGIMLDYYH